jgi:hypothetical protein
MLSKLMINIVEYLRHPKAKEIHSLDSKKLNHPGIVPLNS